MSATHLPLRQADDPGISQRLASASDERRRSVERLLHDGVQQHMALLGLKLSMLQKRIGSDPDAAVSLCEELREEIQGALRELRAVAHLIYPAILEHEGLTPALQHAATRLGVRTTVEIDPAIALPPEIKTSLYFCCLEALENAARHAGDGVSVTVRVTADEQHATFDVVDDGAGFDVNSPTGQRGLGYIADRVHALGGAFDLVSSVGGGTSLRGVVPL